MNPAARRPSHRPPRTSPGDDAAEPRLAPCRPRAVEAFSGDVRAEDVLEGLTVDDAAWAGLDLHSLTLLDCDVRGADLDGTVLQDARLRDTAVQVAHAPTLDAPDSSWSTATLHDSRAGAAVLHGSTWSSVLVVGCRIDFLNLRDASLQDVVFERCTFRDVDLVSARAQRVAFRECSAQSLDVRSAQLQAVDLRGLEFHQLDGLESLRGSVVHEAQLQVLAPLLARHLGITVR